MKRKILALLCAAAIILTTILPVTAADSGYIATNIPKTFPVIRQDSSATVVNFWHAMTGRYAVLVDNIVNWYNATNGKKQKIYVKSVFQGAYDAITTKIQAALQSQNMKNMPDVIQLNSAGAFSVKESKYIIYMDDLIASDSAFKSVKDKLNKNALWACSYKGKLLGMPFSNSMITLHYNATAFKSVGLDPDNPPKTLAEFANDAQKLVIKGTGKKPTRYGASCRAAGYQFATWIPRQKKGTAYQFDMEDGRMGIPTKLTCVENGTLKQH
jgi:sn-glycerol 3-phosphate transport system substrate-binding protein